MQRNSPRRSLDIAPTDEIQNPAVFRHRAFAADLGADLQPARPAKTGHDVLDRTHEEAIAGQARQFDVEVTACAMPFVERHVHVDGHDHFLDRIDFGRTRPLAGQRDGFPFDGPPKLRCEFDFLERERRNGPAAVIALHEAVDFQPRQRCADRRSRTAVTRLENAFAEPLAWGEGQRHDIIADLLVELMHLGQGHTCHWSSQERLCRHRPRWHLR